MVCSGLGLATKEVITGAPVETGDGDGVGVGVGIGVDVGIFTVTTLVADAVPPGPVAVRV